MARVCEGAGIVGEGASTVHSIGAKEMQYTFGLHMRCAYPRIEPIPVAHASTDVDRAGGRAF